MKLLSIFLIVFLPFSSLSLNDFPNRNSLFDLIKPTISDILENSNITRQCLSDLKLYISDLKDLKPWALKMLDATGKLAPGFAYGNQEQVGNYDECLSINENQIIGQFCTVYLEMNGNYTLLYMENLAQVMKYPGFNHLAESYFKRTYPIWEICVPKSCSSTDLNNIFNHINQTYEMPFSGKTTEMLCVYKDKVEPYQTDLLVFIFFGILLSVVVLSTVYDLYLRNTATRGHKHNIFVIFSLYSNTKKLFSVNHNEEDLTCLHGIKVISMVLIVIAHMVFHKSLTGNNNTMFFALEWRETLSAAFILAIQLAVDVFFVLSGMLVIYIYLKRSETSRINLLPFYIHRYLRLLPALFGTVLFHSAIFKYLPAGNKFPTINKFISGNCRNGWWRTLLFIQNWRSEDNESPCVDQAWYLSVDYQLYIFAPIILFNIRKHPGKVLMLMVVVSLISFVVVFYKLFKYQLGFLLIFELDDNLHRLYCSIFLRFPSWLLGTFYGYLIYIHKMKKYKISKNFNLILWLLSLATMLGIFSYYHVYTREKEYSPISSGVMQTFGRFFWCFAICNLIYSLSTGHGRLINAFLSHPVFVVMSKLSYCVFLMEQWVIYWVIGYQKQGRHFTNFQIFHEFWGDFVIILFSATVLHLVFEMPFALLMNYASRGEKRTTGTKSSVKIHPE